MSRDQDSPAPIARPVPSIYVDVAELRPHPYTMQIVLSAMSPEGDVEPRVHLAMSPNFAMHLHQTLGRALGAYTAAAESEPVVPEPGSPQGGSRG